MKRNFFFVLSLFLGLIVSSCCVGARMGRDHRLISLFRFNSGEDYADHLWGNQSGGIMIGIKRPIALDSGYYMTNYTTYPRTDIYFLTFTFDDLDSNRIPEDWQSHWEDYVLAKNPFEQFFTVIVEDCHGKIDMFPAYCSTCESTFYTDTTILNRMIANQEFEFLLGNNITY